MSEALDKKYKKTAQTIGSTFGVSDTLISILKQLIEEKYLDFILAFKSQKSQTMEQLKESSVFLKKKS